MTTAFQSDAFQNNAFQIDGGVNVGIVGVQGTGGVGSPQTAIAVNLVAVTATGGVGNLTIAQVIAMNGNGTCPSPIGSAHFTGVKQIFDGSGDGARGRWIEVRQGPVKLSGKGQLPKLFAIAHATYIAPINGRGRAKISLFAMANGIHGTAGYGAVTLLAPSASGSMTYETLAEDELISILFAAA